MTDSLNIVIKSHLSDAKIEIATNPRQAAQRLDFVKFLLDFEANHPTKVETVKIGNSERKYFNASLAYSLFLNCNPEYQNQQTL